MASSSPPPRLLRIDVRGTADERAKVQALAIRAGLTLSGYFRAVVLAAKPLRAARRPPVGIVLLTQAVAGLGVVASQLRRLTIPSPDSAATPFLERELIQVLGELRKVMGAVLKALGRKVPAA